MELGEGDYGTQIHTAKPYFCLQVWVSSWSMIRVQTHWHEALSWEKVTNDQVLIMQIKIVIDFWLCLVWFRLLKHLTRPQYKEVLFKQTTYRLQHCLHRLSKSNSIFIKYNWFWWKPFNLQFKLYKSNTLWRSKFTFCTNVGKVYYFLTIFRGLDISKIFYDRSKTATIKKYSWDLLTP